MQHSTYLGASGEQTPLHGSCIASAYRFIASDIVRNIREGRWTASEVLEAYIAQAVKAQATTNCLTEGE